MNTPFYICESPRLLGGATINQRVEYLDFSLFESLKRVRELVLLTPNT